MANNSILGQMLEAAVRGGGLGNNSGAGAQSTGGGGLGDLLGQVLGGAGQGSTGQSAGGQPGGSLQDILGGILGGGGQGGGGAAPSSGGGLGDILGSILGGAAGGAAARPSGGTTSGAASDILKDFGSRMGGSPAQVPPAPSVPHPAPAPTQASDPVMPQSEEAPAGGGSDLIKYGGIAILGMLAYKAFKNHQAGGAWGAPPASGKGFLPQNMPGGGEAFSGVLVQAMIAAMQADGVIDADEQRKLVSQLESMGASQSDRQALAQQLNRRIDPATIVAEAKTPEMGMQIYMASALAVTVDTQQERAYLDNLAQRLGIDAGLKAELERTIGRA